MVQFLENRRRPLSVKPGALERALTWGWVPAGWWLWASENRRNWASSQPRLHQLTPVILWLQTSWLSWLGNLNSSRLAQELPRFPSLIIGSQQTRFNGLKSDHLAGGSREPEVPRVWWVRSSGGTRIQIPSPTHPHPQSRGREEERQLTSWSPKPSAVDPRPLPCSTQQRAVLEVVVSGRSLVFKLQAPSRARWSRKITST